MDPNNLNVIQCKLCDFIVKAGIYRLKQHVAGVRGQVQSYPNSTPEDKAKCKKAIDDSKRNKKARQEEQQEVRDVVVLDDGPEDDDTTIRGGLDDLGESSQRKLGPMDRFTKAMDPSSLSNTKVVRQQKISESIWKERMRIA